MSTAGYTILPEKSSISKPFDDNMKYINRLSYAAPVLPLSVSVSFLTCHLPTLRLGDLALMKHVLFLFLVFNAESSYGHSQST